MPRYPTTNLKFYRQNKNCFGGNIYAGNPKYKRPFYHQLALHVVLRSSLAVKKCSMLNHRHKIKWIVRNQAKNFGVEIYRFANSGNHLHILVKPSRDRSDFHGFMRATSGLIARFMLKAERGSPKKQKFWDARPFSRIVNWGKAFDRCANYVEKNIFEALGFSGLDHELNEFFQWRKLTYS